MVQIFDESNEDELIFDLKSLVPSSITSTSIHFMKYQIQFHSNQKKLSLCILEEIIDAGKCIPRLPSGCLSSKQAISNQCRPQGIQSDRGIYISKIWKTHKRDHHWILKLDAPPYEIWYLLLSVHNQTNQCEIFYFTILHLVHNDFQLLHSTCLTGMKNEDWEKILYKTFT